MLRGDIVSKDKLSTVKHSGFLCAFEESADYMLCFHLFAKIQTCTYPYSSNRLYSPRWV